MRATRYPSCGGPKEKAVNLQPSALFPTMCIFDKYTSPEKKELHGESSQMGRVFVLVEPAGLLVKGLTEKSEETKSTRC